MRVLISTSVENLIPSSFSSPTINSPKLQHKMTKANVPYMQQQKLTEFDLVFNPDCNNWPRNQLQYLLSPRSNVSSKYEDGKPGRVGAQFPHLPYGDWWAFQQPLHSTSSEKRYLSNRNFLTWKLNGNAQSHPRALPSLQGFKQTDRFINKQANDSQYQEDSYPLPVKFQKIQKRSMSK